MKKSGDLYKKGDLSTNKRHFLIKRDTLYYYDSIKDTNGTALGQIDLTKLKSVEKDENTKTIDNSTKYEFRLKLHGKYSDVILYSDTLQDCDKWVQTLSNWAREEQEVETEKDDYKEPVSGKKKFGFFASKSEEEM